MSSVKLGSHITPRPSIVLPVQNAPLAVVPGLAPDAVTRPKPIFSLQALRPPQALTEMARVAQGALAEGTKRIIYSDQWARLGQVGTLTAAACGISIATGLLCAYGTTPWLLTLCFPVGPVTMMFSQVPVVGPLLTGLLLRGGPLGAMASGLMLWFTSQALFTDGPMANRKYDWALSAASVGFAISPLFVPGVPVVGALATACLMGAATMAYMTSRRLVPNTPTDGRFTLIATGVSVGLAPMAAQSAMLMASGAILGEALFFPVITCLGIAVHGLWNRMAPLLRENVAASNDAALRHANTLRLDRPGELNPTVFGYHRVLPFAQYMDSIQNDMDKQVAFETTFLILKGESGIGKNAMVMAELHRLGLPIEIPLREDLRASESPAAATTAFFTRCLDKAKNTGKPVAIFLRDLTALLPLRKQGDSIGDEMVNAALRPLERIDGAPPSNVLIIGTMHETDALDSALASRGKVIDVPRNDADALSHILGRALKEKLQRSYLGLEASERSRPARWQLPEAACKTVGHEGETLGMVGRNMMRYADDVVLAVKTQYSQASQSARGVPQSFNMDAALLAAHVSLWPEYKRTFQQETARQAGTVQPVAMPPVRPKPFRMDRVTHAVSVQP